MRPLTAVLLSLGMVLAACSESAPGEPDPDTAAGFFAPDRVLKVEIEIPTADWDELRFQTRTLSDILGGDCLAGPPDDIFTFYPASVSVDGERFDEVALRKKGFLGSLSYEKPSLKLRFDKYVEGQLLGGEMKRLTLNNVQQDPSRLNTCMSYQVYAAAGMPAPRCNFATVSVNGTDLGLYVHVESIKKAFLRRNFATDEGNLYEGTLSDFREGWSGTFEKKTNEVENDWSDIEAVTRALSDPSETGTAALAEIIDIDHFLSFWALEVIIGHWDGYAGNRNNNYIYREPDGRFLFIPWGPDSSFAHLDHPFDNLDRDETPQSVTAHGGIAHRLYQEASSRENYLQRLRDLLEQVWDEDALLAEIDRMSDIVQEHALSSTRGDAMQDTERLRDFVLERRGVILDEVDGENAQWPWPLDPANICWAEQGAVDLSFDARWGTHNASNITQEGDVDVSSYLVDNQQLSFVSGGATAGYETRPEAEGMATISLGNVQDDGTLELLVIRTWPELLQNNYILPFDEWVTHGYRVVIPPPYTSPQVVGRLGSGTIEFTQAATSSNARVAGQVRAILYDLGQAPAPYSDPGSKPGG